MPRSDQWIRGTAVLVPCLFYLVHAGAPGIKLRTMTSLTDETQLIPRLTAVVDGAVELQCNLSVPASNHDKDNVTLVLWSKSDVHGPLYSVDARNTPLERAKHFPSPELAGRYEFNTSTHPAVLRVDPVRLEDAGEFKCRVDFRWARTHTFVMALQVIVPPKEVIIFDELGKPLQDVVGPYDEGSPLSLTCEAIGGTPVPTVTWWRDTVPLDGAYSNVSEGVARNRLFIPKLERSDARATIGCQAANTNLTLPVYTSVTIDMNLRPLDVKISSAREPLVSGHRVELTCQSRGALPAARITWWKGTEQLIRTVEKVDASGNVTSNTLIFVPGAEDHERLLTCKADNPQLAGSTIEDAMFLSVIYVPKLSLSVSSGHKSGAILEGSDVALECVVRANPPVRDVWWKHDGRLLDRRRDASPDLVFGNHSLKLLRIARAMRGLYQCLASNSQGQGESNELQIQVKYAPVCRGGQKQAYGVARDETAKVSCELDADPADVVFQWRFNNSFEERHLAAMSLDVGLRSVASYIPRSRADYGSLLCWGKNSVGVQLKPCVFSIQAAGPPEPLSNCNVLNATADSLQIACDSGYDGGLEQTFHLEVIDSLRSETLATKEQRDRAVFFVHPLPPGTEFIVRAFAQNAKGRSDSDIFTTSTEELSTGNNGDSLALSMSPLLGVLIGAIAALVLVAVIIAIIMRMRVHDTDTDSGEPDTTEKSQTLLRKAVEDRAEGDIKDPDIIPPKGDLEDPEWVFRQLNGSNGRISRDVGVTKGAMMYGTLPNVKIQRHPQFSDDMMYRERYLLGQEYGGVVERHRATGFRPQGSLPDPDEVDRMISSNTPLVSGTQLRPQRRDTPERERRTISTPV